MLCKYSCKFNCIFANSFSDLNDFPNLNLILVNITDTAYSSDEVKRTLSCKTRMFAQLSPTAVISCCLHCQPSPHIKYKLWRLSKKGTQNTSQGMVISLFTLCTNMGILLSCTKPPAIPKSFCIHVRVCFRKGTSCIIEMQTIPGWRRASHQSMVCSFALGKSLHFGQDMGINPPLVCKAPQDL